MREANTVTRFVLSMLRRAPAMLRRAPASHPPGAGFASGKRCAFAGCAAFAAYKEVREQNPVSKLPDYALLLLYARLNGIAYFQ